MGASKFRSGKAILGLAACLMAGNLYAHEAGDWLLRTGLSSVDPKSNNHGVVSVDSQTGLTINLAYMLTDNWSVEVLGSQPLEHDIDLLGGTPAGDTKHLPPTVSIQYHFFPEAKVQPYIGAGINYTLFFSESTQGPLAGSNLKLDDSIGLAWELGVDIPVNDQWFINLDFRYIDIDTDASLDGADLGTVSIDPKVYGVHLGYRF